MPRSNCCPVQNGLSKDANGIVELGGSLLHPTAIGTNASNTLAITGLQTGALTDTIVVQDPVTGVLKQVPVSTLLSNENEVLRGVGAPVAAPTVGVAETHLWVDTATNQITHYWNGSAWLALVNPENEVLIGTVAPVAAPVDPTERKLWVNSTTNQVTHYWNGSAWVALVNPENEVLTGTVAPVAAPADPSERKLWVNTTSNTVTHYWNGIAWVPLVGAFPIILLCSGAAAPSTARFLTADAGSGISNAALGGVTPTSRVLWSFANDGSGCPVELTAPATPCTNAAIPTGSVFLGNLADGTVGWVRPRFVDRPNVRIATGVIAAVLATDNIIQVTGSGSVELPAINPADLCESRRITVKRVSNNPVDTVRVLGIGGLDGAPGNTIGLGTSSSFGTLTGESATFYHDGTTWRIESRY